MRAHLYHLFRTLQTGRKITFWYGDGEFLGNLPVSTSLGTEKLLVLVPKV